MRVSVVEASVAGLNVNPQSSPSSSVSPAVSLVVIGTQVNLGASSSCSGSEILVMVLVCMPNLVLE